MITRIMELCWKNQVTFGMVDELATALLLCLAAGDNVRFERICDAVQPRMATSKLRGGDDPPLAFGQLMMIIVSQFRKRAIPKLSTIEQEVANGRSMRTKYLLAAWNAIQEKSAVGFTDAITKSLEYFRDHPDPNYRPGHFLTKIAVAESILCNIANRNELEVTLQTELADMTILSFRNLLS